MNIQTLFALSEKKGKMKITKPFTSQDCGVNFNETCEMCSCKNIWLADAQF